MSTADPFGDRAHLEAKREERRKPAPTLDPALPGSTSKPSKDKTTSAPHCGVIKWKRKRTTYHFREGFKYREKTFVYVSERTLAIIEAAEFEGLSKTELCETFKCSPRAIAFALQSPSSVAIKKDMLARIKDSGYTRAHARVNELIESDDPKAAFAASKFRIEERDGKATQRIQHAGQVVHTHRMVSVTRSAEELDALELKQSKPGVFTLPEE